MKTTLSVLLASTLIFVGATAGHAAQKKIKAFKYKNISSMMIMPGESADVGVEKVVSAGDVVLKTAIAFEDAAVLDADITVNLAGIDSTILKTDVLRGVTLKGGDIAALPEGSRIYCAEGRPIDKKLRPKKEGEGRDSGKRRIEYFAAPCLVDTNADNSFDRALLIGAKWQEDRKTVEIPDTPYEAFENKPLNDSYFTVTFQKGGLLQGHILKPAMTLNGVTTTADGYFLNKPDSEKQKIYKHKRAARKTYPYGVKYGEAKIALMGYDRENKKLTLKVEKDFALSPMGPYYAPQYIYIAY